MTKLEQAAQQALDALKLSTPKPRSTEDDYAERGWREHNAAITALLDALAEPAPEPVASPQRQPLTDEQIVSIYETPELAGTEFANGTEKAIAIFRAAERAHNIGGDK